MLRLEQDNGRVLDNCRFGTFNLNRINIIIKTKKNKIKENNDNFNKRTSQRDI